MAWNARWVEYIFQKVLNEWRNGIICKTDTLLHGRRLSREHRRASQCPEWHTHLHCCTQQSNSASWNEANWDEEFHADCPSTEPLDDILSIDRQTYFYDDNEENTIKLNYVNSQRKRNLSIARTKFLPVRINGCVSGDHGNSERRRGTPSELTFPFGDFFPFDSSERDEMVSSLLTTDHSIGLLRGSPHTHATFTIQISLHEFLWENILIKDEERIYSTIQCA